MIQRQLVGKEVLGKPFLKWAGGKSQLLPVIRGLYPPGLKDGSITRYVEPFLGGGAVFFDIVQSFDIEEAHLFDINEELILCYKVVQAEPEALASSLDFYRARFLEEEDGKRSDYFYSVRLDFNREKPLTNFDVYNQKWIQRAAQFIFLNKTCFNGLFRVNSSGLFNVPFGGYRNPEVFNVDDLLRASALLQRAKLHRDHYSGARDYVKVGSFVYFDPPYRPLTSSSSFTSYSQNGFDDTDQLQLAEFFAELSGTSGAHLMVSNSDPHNVSPTDDFFDNAYHLFHINRVAASRMINSNGQGRGKISELLVTNYEITEQ